VVLMGDLNTAAHGRDLELLYERTSLTPPQDSPATFPSWRPTRALDHILVSGSIEVEKRWVVPHPVSDHLPIAASVRLPEPSTDGQDRGRREGDLPPFVGPPAIS
jgi:endonuclease/exonuclease/phosphatase family metal-dependent hydrolase